MISNFVSNFINELKEYLEKDKGQKSEKEGTLYRKQFFANGSYSDGFYDIDKYEKID